MLCVRSVGLAFFLPLLAHATKPQHAVWQSYDDFAAGNCVSTSLTEDGVLAQAPGLKKIDLGVEEAWSVARQANGTILVGSAPEGKLLQVSPSGDVHLFAKFGESHLYAITLGPHGEIYVGTSPDGKVYSVDKTGKAQVYFDPGEKYIWALVVAPDGTLYVGTGTRGRIYRVKARGAGELWYASDETHIRALSFDATGALLAGSAESGYLYRVTGKDQAVVLAATGHEEVNQILSRSDGTIYFTATGAAKDGSAKNAPVKKAGDGVPSASGDPETSALYRLNAAFNPQQVWSTKATILAMALNESELTQGGVLLGTANDGYAYSVAPHGEATRLCRVDSGSITAVFGSGKGQAPGSPAIFATSNPGRLFLVASGPAPGNPGLFETDVLDSQSFARWGAVGLGASDSHGVTIATRSGNTAQPDKTWHSWVAAPDGQSQSPPARYLQVQLQISAGTVDRIDACFLPRNLPPHLESLKILPVGLGYTPAPASPLPPLPQSAAQLLAGGAEPDPKTPMRYVPQNGHGLRTLIWKASDPNGDELTYDVSWRKRGEADWHDLAKGLTENLLTWDTSSWSEGRYELKVEASDAAANAPGAGLTDVAISREMVVNNTPPAIQITDQKSDSVEFTVKDELSGLQSVTISTDGKNYQPITPVDGLLDSGLEHFRARLAPGQSLFIRAEDGSGNVAGLQTGK